MMSINLFYFHFNNFNNNMTQVLPHLYIGGSSQAESKRWLKSHDITHIVNAAIELDNHFPRDFTYLRLNLDDTPRQSLYRALEPAHIFIQNAIRKGGNVLVHCHMGISRSSSVVIYYLMRTKGWDFLSAYAYMRAIHPRTYPNAGFCKQLASLVQSPAKKRGRTTTRKRLR